MLLIPKAVRNTPIIILLAALLLQACGSIEWSAKAPDAVQMMSDVTYLADDALEGRTFGSKGEELAAEYISKRFKQLDLKPKGENGTWFQSLTVNKPDPHSMSMGSGTDTLGKTGRNVIGFMDHGAPYTIVLGAHFDHLGYGGFGSLHAGEPAIHN